MIKKLLLVFIRNPQLGRVKFRLAQQTSDETALAVYNDLLSSTHRVTKELTMDKWVFYSEEVEQDDIWDTGGFEKRVQSGGDLGNKMYQAFKQGFEAGYHHIVLIGSDIEHLSADIINDAFHRLEEQTVIGPATDGGYYLLGLRELRNDIFNAKEWGTETILNETIAHFNDEIVFLLPALNDIDVLEDIKPGSPLFKHVKYKYHVIEEDRGEC